MTKGRRFILTGSEGYLMKSLITKLKRSPEVEKIFGLDIRESSDQEDDKFEYHRIDVTDSVRVTSLFQAARVTDVIHAAWTFNPTKNVEMQDMVDIKGTQNVITATRKSGAENIVYLGSSTCYGQLPEDPNEDPFLQENEWSRHMFKRINASYRYARNKAIVDLVFQNLQHNPSLNVFWIRGAIVIGPNTNNVVSFMAEAPFSLNFLNSLLKKFMFSVGGHNPHMQFISEHDMTEILYRACMERWSGVANVAGTGTLKFDEVAKSLGKRELNIPSFILFPFCELLWKMGIIRFPSSILNLIKYPWVGDISNLQEKYGYIPRHSSREALNQFVKG